MNGAEQKERQTAVARMEREFRNLQETTTDAYQVEYDSRVKAMAELELKLTNLIRDAINGEHLFVLKMANEQRTYVDRADKDTNALILACAMMPWWKRYLWCIFGGRAVQKIEARLRGRQ